MSSPLMRSIDSAVAALEQSCIELMRELVRTPSITGDETAAQLLLAARLREMQLEVDAWSPTHADVESHPAFSDDGTMLGDRPVVVARWRGTDLNARSLILNGHIDVVPPGDERAWRDGAWSGDVRDNRLWGRGSCDMKAGLAAAVTAVAALQRLGVRPRGDILIESVIGEETGGVGTLATLLRGYQADAAVILEPTRMAACPVGAGALSFRLHVRGRAAHAASRLEGVSAVDKFYTLATAIERLERHRHTGFHHRFYDAGELVAPISIGTVHAGNWPSTVPEALVAEGRYGVLPGEDTASARRQFEAAVQAAADADDWLRRTPPLVEWFEGQFESGETPSDAPILAALADAHRDVCDREAHVHGVPYGSDLRLFTNHGGMHAVLYGPGDVRIAHTLDEFVPLDEVQRVTRVIARTIVDWCGVD